LWDVDEMLASKAVGTSELRILTLKIFLSLSAVLGDQFFGHGMGTMSIFVPAS